MYFKVKITKRLPQAKSGGFTGNNLNKQVISFGGADMNAASRHLENTRYLKEVPRDEANLEAEKGETAFGDINGDGFTEHMLIGGKRHSQGGTALNLPDGTFIFSDTAAMKINDPEILTKFGKKSGSFTPAELAKPYDINKYRTILEDPNSDKVDKKTAELMIKNINLKLGALALAQESKKGFPQGIPEVAQPYMQQMGIREEDLIPQKPVAQINNQAMNNPYENQGMGMQSPEEEMMEQGPSMQNPQEEMMEMPPMAQYGIMMGDNNYTRNFAGDQQYREGGSLTRYQSKGEVKSKAYTKDQLPKDAVVRDRLTVDIQPGDFVKQSDGTYLKVSKSGTGKVTADTKSLGMSVEEFKKQSPENALLIENANAIIKKGIDDKTIKNDNGKIKITGDWKGDFKDRILLSRALNATNAKGVFGTDKYKIVSQSATGPYSKLNPKTGKLKGTGSFVAGFTPDLYEQRYVYEQAKGLGMTDDEAFAEVDRIQKDKKAKALVRRQFASTLGLKDIPKDDDALLSEDFYKKNYSDVTKGIESLGASEYRPAIGDEQLSGFEHFDALGYKPEYQYEQDMPVTEEDAKKAEEEVAAVEETPEAQYQRNPEWWLQDKIKMGLAAGDYFGVKKRLPWAPRYEPQLMTPTFYNPTRELAAQSEQANITNQALAQFTGPQALSARSASVQGQGAKQAADTLARYNAQNVGVANQFEGNNAQIMNEAQRFNQAQNKQLYDQNVIANQQYENTKRALRHNLGEAFIAGTTNMMKTDAMNQMYPQYAVDPRSGGRMHFTKGKDYKPEMAASFDSLVQKYMGPPYYMEGEAAVKAAKTSSGYSSGSDGVDPNMIGAMYGKKGGAVQMAYVMGSNVFPFMFT